MKTFHYYFRDKIVFIDIKCPKLNMKQYEHTGSRDLVNVWIYILHFSSHSI